MNDDWRVHVQTQDETAASDLAAGLERFDLAHDLGGGLHDRVAVSHDGVDVFLYTGTREQAEATRRAVDALAEERGWKLTYDMRRWHTEAERWEDPDAPLPESEASLKAEHLERTADERAESLEHGYPEFEVRVSCKSDHAARKLAAQLSREGIKSVQRWRFLVIGANDEDAAQELVERLRAEAPAGTEIVAEGSVPWVANAAPLSTPFNPFAVFGGLGG